MKETPKSANICKFFAYICADVAELVYAYDSKSYGRKVMWVRFPPSAPKNVAKDLAAFFV